MNLESQRSRTWSHPDIWVGALVLALLSALLLWTPWDLKWAAAFWGPKGFSEAAEPWRTLYRYGTLPGLLVSAASLVVLIGSWLKPAWKKWRRAAALVLLTLLLGPGLLVNTVGKGYWGRPRPRDLVQFQGTETFRPFCLPGTPGRGQSFPCGHASVGFLFMVFYFIDPHRKRRWAWLAGGGAYGTLMGLARMAQGAHFASDVLWSGGLTYLSAAVLQHVLLPKQWGAREPLQAQPLWVRISGWMLIAGSLYLLAMGFLVATPYYRTWQGQVPWPRKFRALSLKDLPPNTRVVIQPTDDNDHLSIETQVQGFGLPKLKLEVLTLTEARGNTLSLRVRMDLNRLYTERKNTLRLQVPNRVQVWPENPGTGLRWQDQRPPTAKRTRH